MLNKSLLKVFAWMLLLLTSPSGVFGALYKWVDENGNTHYSDVAPASSKTKAQQIQLEPLNSIESSHIKIDHTVSDSNSVESEEIETPKANRVENNSSSKECFGPSPKTSHTNLVRAPLQESQHQDISTLLGKMKGWWKGEGVLTKCSGTKTNPTIEIDKFDTSSEFTFRRSKEMRIEFDMYSSKLGKAINENIKLFLSEEYLSFSPSQSDGTVLFNSTSDTIELWVEQYPFYGVHNELVRIFTLQSSSMVIEQYSYSNGELESSLIWKLAKR